MILKIIILFQKKDEKNCTDGEILNLESTWRILMRMMMMIARKKKQRPDQTPRISKREKLEKNIT
jgi:hypothetical protein